MRSVWILFIMLLCASVTAQEVTPEADTLSTFVSENGVVSFSYPVAWDVYEDLPTSFFIDTGGTLVFLVEIIEAPSANTSAEAMLNLLFPDEGYTEPQPITLTNQGEDTGREGAYIEDEHEHLITFRVDDEHFALFFVIESESLRDEYEADVMTVLRTFTYNGEQPEVTPEAPPSPLVEGQFDFLNGTLSLSYPEQWVVRSQPNLGILFTDEAESFSIVLLGDMEFMLDYAGGEGNVNDIRSPRDLMQTILSSVDPALFDDLIEETLINDQPVVQFTASDDLGDTVMIATSLGTGDLILLILSADQGEYARMRRDIDALLRSLVYVEDE